MPRLAQDVIVVSQPVRTFPNGDIFFIELIAEIQSLRLPFKDGARRKSSQSQLSSFERKAKRFAKPKRIAIRKLSTVVPIPPTALHETRFEI